MNVAFKSYINIHDGDFAITSFDTERTGVIIEPNNTLRGYTHCLTVGTSGKNPSVSEYITEDDEGNELKEGYYDFSEVSCDHIWIKDKKNVQKLATVLNYAQVNDDFDLDIYINDNGEIEEITNHKGKEITIKGEKLDIAG